MVNALQLLELQLDLESKAINANGYLIQTRVVPDEGTLRVSAVDFGDDHQTFFGAGIPGELERALRYLPFETFFNESQAVIAILERHRPCPHFGHYITYRFPDGLPVNEDPRVQMLDPSDSRLEPVGGGFYRGTASPVFAFLEEDRVLSVCVSVRETALAGELWVLTLPEARSRGFARRVTLAWQQHLKAQGRIPIYSHKRENTPSQRLAESLGLIKVYEQAGFA